MVLVLLLAKAFVFMIHNFKQVGGAGWVGTEAWDRGLTLGSKHECSFCPFMQGSLGCTEKGKETLRSFVTDITARTAGKALSLVIVDQEKYFRFEFVLKTWHPKGQLLGQWENLFIPDLGTSAR